jgi:hypothetical protein
MPNRVPSQAHDFRSDSVDWRFHTAAAHVLQSEAWEACNRAYHEAYGEPYREIGRELYQKVLHERIQALFMKGDEQNLRIEPSSGRAA